MISEFKKGDKIEYIYAKGYRNECWYRATITSIEFPFNRYEKGHMVIDAKGREFSMQTERMRLEKKVDFMKVMGAN